MQDVQSLLDSMLPPSEENLNCIAANKRLDPKDKDMLRGIVSDFEAQNEKYKFEECKLEDALDHIAQIMGRFNNVAKKVKGKAGNLKICLQPNTEPFLIKQVLFYMVVAVIMRHVESEKDDKSGESAKSGKDVLDNLKNKGVVISHNFFSRMQTTPVSYVRMKEDAIPEMPASYMGQKRGELGVAIRNLVYQAGKYDTFVDIFGGSGAASVSVTRDKGKNKKKYVYNELNWAVYNLFEVIADPKLFELLVSEVKELQAALKGNKSWISEEVLEKAAEKFSEKHANAMNVKEIMEDDFQDMFLDLEEVWKWLCMIRENIKNDGLDTEFILDSGKYSGKDLLKEFFSMRWSKQGRGFLLNYQLIKEYTERYRLGADLLFLGGNSYSVTKGREERMLLVAKDRKFMRGIFFRYYAYFEEVLASPAKMDMEGKVHCAVAEIYYQTFRTSGRADVSSILRMLEWLNSTGSNDYKKMLDENFVGRIIGMHSRVAGTVCENMDCIEVIKKYGGAGRKTLFYSDSPYVATADYEDDAQGVESFGVGKMEELVKALDESGGKFIFSCRAVKNSVKRKEATKEIEEANKRIMEEVHKKFERHFSAKKKPLFVLAVEKKGKDLAALIRDNEVAEVMITNYKICDFEDLQKCPATRFKVYPFKKFMEIVKKNANGIK